MQRNVAEWAAARSAERGLRRRRARLRARPVAVGPLLAQLARGLDDRAERGEGERAAGRDPRDAGPRELGDRRACPGSARTLTGRPTAATTARMSSIVAQAGRVEDVGARRLVGLQPRDRVGEVARPRRWFSARAVSTSVARPACATARRPRRARRPSPASRIGVARRSPRSSSRRARRPARGAASRATPPGVGAKHVLEVGRDRQVGRRDDRRRVRERLVARDAAVAPAERRREAAARRGERLEAERREQPRRAGVPRVGHEQRRAPARGARGTARPARSSQARLLAQPLGAHHDPRQAEPAGRGERRIDERGRPPGVATHERARDLGL